MSLSTKAIRLGSSDVLMFTFPTVVRFSRGSRKASSNGSSVHLVLYHCVSPPPCSRSDRKISLAINLHQKSHPIPPQSLLILSISDALDLCFLNTGVRGIPHLTRSIDPIPRRSESLYSQLSFSIFAAAELTRKSDDRVSFGEAYPRVTCTLLPLILHITPYLRCEPPLDSSSTSSTLGSRRISSDFEFCSVRRIPSQSNHEMSFINFYLGLENSTCLTGPHFLLLVSQPIFKVGWFSLLD
ncbi:BnaCnng29810D [Brassica napus]|uniref:(rape) hypothetical protein n=1 Tax=Brassica napus TaxID=3708 RepID=A0A078IZR3_BRANA|nr:unnamed protein product [Brassica napus]CDY56063.1 BnaCnng29810D [Brassica napus]